jgi:hypothetical protein
MLNNISWGSYWSAITVSLILYYAYVLFQYYGKEIKIRFNSAVAKPESIAISGYEILPAIAQSLGDEVISYLEQAARSGIIKNEILFALRQIAAKYENVKKSRYQNDISGLMQSECFNKCAIHLSDGDMRYVWMVDEVLPAGSFP